MNQRVKIVEKNPRRSYENVWRKKCILPSTIILRQWPPLATNKTRMRRVEKPPKKINAVPGRKKEKRHAEAQRKHIWYCFEILPSARLRAFSGLAKVAMVDKRPAQDHSAPPIDLQAQKTAAYNTLEGLRERWKRETRLRAREEEQKRWRRAQTPCERQTLTFWNCAYYRAGGFPAVRFPRRL